MRRAAAARWTSSIERWSTSRSEALQSERGPPHDGLVGRLEPGRARPVDDLLHRARPLHRLLERSPIGGQHRPHHRAGHRDPGGMLRANRQMTMPPAIAAPPMITRPDAGRLAPRRIAAPPAMMATTPLATQRATTRLGFSTTQPPLTTMVLELRVELRHARSELGQLVRLDEACSPSPGAQAARSAYSSAGPMGLARVARPLRLLDRVARSRRRLHADLVRQPEQALLLAEREQPARGEVEHRGRQGAPRERPSMTNAPDAGGQVRRRRRHEDRRVVEVDRVLAVSPPGEEGPAGQPEEDDRRADEPEHGVDLASGLERWASSGVAAASILCMATFSAPSKSASLEERHHVVLEDRLPLARS